MKLTGPGLHPGVTISIYQQLQTSKSRMQSLVSGNPPLIHRTNSSTVHGRHRPQEVRFKLYLNKILNYVLKRNVKNLLSAREIQ